MRALHLTGGTPISTLEERYLLRRQPSSGTVLILNMARPVDQAVALLACARAGTINIIGGEVRMALGTSHHSSTGKSPFFHSLDADLGNVLPWAIGCLRHTPAFHEVTGMPLRDRLGVCMEVIRAIRKAQPPTGRLFAEPVLPAEPAMLAPPVAATADRLPSAKVKYPTCIPKGHHNNVLCSIQDKGLQNIHQRVPITRPCMSTQHQEHPYNVKSSEAFR